MRFKIKTSTRNNDILKDIVLRHNYMVKDESMHGHFIQKYILFDKWLFIDVTTHPNIRYVAVEYYEQFMENSENYIIRSIVAIGESYLGLSDLRYYISSCNSYKECYDYLCSIMDIRNAEEYAKERRLLSEY
jgi:hypothetical protein